MAISVSSARIRQLPPSVVNKIAAGEVIERPASVVKELLENSVDAGATRIDVTVEQGGTDLIRIVDNGHGMTPDDLPLAVASHATSKIRDADDLFHVATLGFRGEALASIAEISQLTIRSRTSEADAGSELIVAGGIAEPIVPCGCPIGTSMEIRNLFYNTPVRRKFMRTTQTEMGHCSEALTRVALASPEIHFTLRHNQRLIWDLPPVEDWRERVAGFFGQDLAAALIAVEGNDDYVHLSGYVANPSQSRGNNRMQYLFLNGRCIRDRSLQHALGEAYRGLLLTGRYPICFLRLDLDPHQVDVNVHPTKLEVRFQDGGRVYSQLLGTLRTRFLTTDLTTKLGDKGPGSEEDPSQSAHDSEQTARLRQEFVDWAKGQLSSAKDGRAEGEENDAEDPQQHLGLTYESNPEPNLQLNRIVRPFKPFGDDPGLPASGRGVADDGAAGGERTAGGSAAAGAADAGEWTGPVDPRRSAALQVHNRYLITEDADGMMVIDQHALHERILYEQIRAKVLSGELESQRLLVPEPVHLTSAESAAALENQDLLAQLGIAIAPFGGDTVLVSSYPAMLANLSPGEILRQLIELLMSGGKAPDRRDVIDELLHMISCKAAIKAGDRLSPQEIDALLAQRHLVQDSHHCPHGRPTSLVFTRAQLDRLFKRT